MTLNMTSLCHAHGHVTDKRKLYIFLRATQFVYLISGLYSFLHPANQEFLFILENVLFKEINDIEIPIEFLNKMF